MKAIKVGLIGFGTVGTGVVRLLTEQRELLARRLGTDLVLAKVADLDLERPRPVAVPRELLTTRAQDILDDPEIDIVVELIGGTDRGPGLWSWPPSTGASTWSPPTRPCWPTTATICWPRPRPRAWRSPSRPRCAAASPSSWPCARGWPPTASRSSSAS